MSDIRVSRSHSLDAIAREQALCDLRAYLADTLKARKKVVEGEIMFTGTGYSGAIRIDETRVSGFVRLGILMKPMKGVINREIGTALDLYLGTA